MPFRKKSRVLYRWPAAITVASAVVLARGWWVSDPSGMPFSRAGALVTAFTLLFAFWPYSQSLEDKAARLTAAVRDEAVKRGFSENAKPAQEMVQEFSVVARRRILVIRRWEALLLMFGTLVWGFGDVVCKDWQNHLSWAEIIRDLWRFGTTSS